MKNKKNFLLLSICITLLISNFTFADIDLDLGDEPMDTRSGFMKSSYVTLKGGYDMKGKGELENDYNSLDGDIENAFCASLEFLGMMGQNIGLGAGATYQFPRGIDEPGWDDEEFNFVPLYGLLKVYIPTGSIAPFGTLHLGYNFFLGNDEFKADGFYELKGGFYWGLGGGIMLSNGLQFELLYSVNNGTAVPETYNDGSYFYDDISVKYSKITISLGFNF